MKYIICEQVYRNTGGHCMVGFSTVYFPEENRTLFVFNNYEFCQIATADILYLDGEYDLNKVIVEYYTAEEGRSKTTGSKYAEVLYECQTYFDSCAQQDKPKQSVFSIKIEQTLTGYVDIEASSAEEATAIAYDRYVTSGDELPDMDDLDLLRITF